MNIEKLLSFLSIYFDYCKYVYIYTEYLNCLNCFEYDVWMLYYGCGMYQGLTYWMQLCKSLSTAAKRCNGWIQLSVNVSWNIPLSLALAFQYICIAMFTPRNTVINHHTCCMTVDTIALPFCFLLFDSPKFTKVEINLVHNKWSIFE